MEKGYNARDVEKALFLFDGDPNKV